MKLYNRPLQFLLMFFFCSGSYAIPVNLSFESTDILYTAFPEFPVDHFVLSFGYDTEGGEVGFGPDEYNLNSDVGIGYLLTASSTGESRDSAAGPNVYMSIHNNVFNADLGEIQDQVVLTAWDRTQKLEVTFTGGPDILDSFRPPIEEDLLRFPGGVLQEHRGYDQYLFFAGRFSTSVPVPEVSSTYLLLAGLLILYVSPMFARNGKTVL